MAYFLMRIQLVLRREGAHCSLLITLFAFALSAFVLFTFAGLAWAQGLSRRTEGPSKVDVGRAFTYTLTVSNAGSGKASNVVCEDTLPRGVSVDSLPSNCTASKPNT